MPAPIKTGYIALFTLLFFSVLFYLERTCFSDVAFQSFLIINTKNVAYQLDRFGSALIHIFPLAGVWLGLPLKGILLVYSVAFVLQNLFFYWLLHRVFRQEKAALLLALFNVLMVTETFYWTTSEIKQGYSFIILLSGAMAAMSLNFSADKKFFLALLLHGTLLITAFFLHPLSVFSLLYMFGFLLLHDKSKTQKTVLCLGILLAATLLVKYFLLPVHSYDRDKFEMRENFVRFFPDYFSLSSFEKFFAYCRHDWYLYAVLFASVVAYYVYTRKTAKLLLLVLCTLGYLLMVNVSFPDGATKFYIETFYLALSLFVLYPVVFDLLPRINTGVAVLLLALVFFLRLNTIYHAHNPYRERLVWVNETLAAHPGKFIITPEYDLEEKLKLSWGVPFEAALLSSFESPDSCRSFILLNAGHPYRELPDSGDYFISIFGKYPYENINPRYFRPAQETYRIIGK